MVTVGISIYPESRMRENGNTYRHGRTRAYLTNCSVDGERHSGEREDLSWNQNNHRRDYHRQGRLRVPRFPGVIVFRHVDLT